MSIYGEEWNQSCISEGFGGPVTATYKAIQKAINKMVFNKREQRNYCFK